MVYFGWDISTAYIGCCCMRDDGTVVKIEALRLDNITEGLYAKFCPAEDGVRRFITDCRTELGPDAGVEVHCIEQRLENMVGKTRKSTLLALAAINAVISHVIIDMCGRDYTRLLYLYPVQVKKIIGLKVPKGGDKKSLTVEMVRRLYPEFPYQLNRGGINPVDGTYDMADAYITALAAQRSKGEPGKKVVPAKKSAGKTRVRKASKV